MIYLSPRTDILMPDVGAGALVVHHKSYETPHTSPEARHMLWDDFVEAPRAALVSCSLLVVVGLSRILTPANRTKLGPYLLRPTPGLRRISVDRTLFIAEPWRAWWHFGCVGAAYQDYTYSYLAESHWRAAQDGVREDPFTIDAITNAGKGVIVAQGGPYFEPLQIKRVQMPEAVHTAYAQEKERAFNEEHTPKAIIGRLESFARAALPERSVMSVSQLFAHRRPMVTQTDLRVDDWLVGQLGRLVEMTNQVAERFAV